MSYLLEPRELAVLADLSEVGKIPFLVLPELDRNEQGKILNRLAGKGCLSVDGENVTVDTALGFTINAMADSVLFIERGGVLAFCSDRLAVAVELNRNSGKLRLTPLRNASECADALWNEDKAKTGIFSVFADDVWRDVKMDCKRLLEVIQKVYLTEG